MSEMAVIARSTEQAHIRLKELAEALGAADRQEAHRALRACMMREGTVDGRAVICPSG